MFRIAIAATLLCSSLGCALLSSAGPAASKPQLEAADPKLAGILIEVPQPAVRGPDAQHGLELSADLRQALSSALREAGFRVSTGGPASKQASAEITLTVEYCYADVVRSDARLSVVRDGERIGELLLPAAEMPTPQFAERTAIAISNYLAKLETLANGAPPVTTPSAEHPESVVAVLDIQGKIKGVDQHLLSQLTDYLTAQVVQHLRWKALARSQIRDTIQSEKAASYSACVDDACQIELGKALAAEKVLATKLLAIGKECKLVSSIYDLRTEAAERAATVTSACDSDALAGAVDQLVRDLRRER